MKEEFKVKIQDINTYLLTSSDIDSLDITKDEAGNYHLIYEGKSIAFSIRNRDFINRDYTVALGKRAYDMTIQNPLDIQISSMGFEVAEGSRINHIIAPMPGLILNVSIKTGQQVKENDPLLVLEAMKMENVLTAPRDGVIKKICCAKGDAVEKTQLLIEFEN